MPKHMSRKERKAVSERMRRYWSNKRREQATASDTGLAKPSDDPDRISVTVTINAVDLLALCQTLPNGATVEVSPDLRLHVSRR